MTERTRKSAVFLLLQLFCLSSAAAQGAPDVLQRSEISTAKVNTALEVVQRLRPDWLRPHRNGITIVYLDGARSGGLESLTGIPVVIIGSMEYRSGSRVGERLTGASADGVAAIIDVSTRAATREPQAPLRVRVLGIHSFYALPVGSDPSDWRGAMVDHRWIETGEGPARPATAMVGIRLQLTPDYSMEVLAGREMETHSETYSRKSNLGSISVRYRAGMAGLLFARDWRLLRLGAGPMIRQSNYDWGAGDCMCINRHRENLLQGGVAGDAALALPLVGPFGSELRLEMQHYFTKHLPVGNSAEHLPVGGTRMLLGLGLGFGNRPASAAPEGGRTVGASSSRTRPASGSAPR